MAGSFQSSTCHFMRTAPVARASATTASNSNRPKPPRRAASVTTKSSRYSIRPFQVE